MEKNFYSEKYTITDLLLSTDLTKTEIAKRLDISIPELNKRIKSYNLDWVSAKKRKMSRGQGAIVDILKKILPNEKIEFEHHVGERLLVDVYVPSYNLGIEYHGRQHFHYSAYFHKSEAEFQLSQDRDDRKIELCKQKGITLVTFRYNDSLDEDSVFNRILIALKEAEPVPQNVCSKTNSEEYDQIRKELKDRVNRQRKAKRKEMKALRDNDVELKRQREDFKRKMKQQRRDLRESYKNRER